MPYRLTVAAEEDMIDLLKEGVELFGIRQAEAYYHNLLDTFDFLADNPRSARLREEITPPVRVHPYVSHLIVYRLEDDDVTVVAIRHSRQDWANFDR